MTADKEKYLEPARLWLKAYHADGVEIYQADIKSLADFAAAVAKEARAEEATVLKTVLDALEPYVGHSIACGHNDRSFSGGYCTCEERWARSIIKEQRERLALREQP